MDTKKTPAEILAVAVRAVVEESRRLEAGRARFPRKVGLRARFPEVHESWNYVLPEEWQDG